MTTEPALPYVSASASATDPRGLERLFGTSEGLLPLWIAEPYLPLSPAVTDALTERASSGWYGYEVRPKSVVGAFTAWMRSRHGWDAADHTTLISPSMGTSIGAALELTTTPGDRVILQPPVFTDFKPLVTRAHRKVGRNSLLLDEGRYRMDLDGLASLATEPSTTAMILCNPHNPVGRVWTPDELRAVARICAEHGVFVISDEIHADVTLGEATFAPFATAAEGTGVRWAAMHGPIKTFGLAGVADTLIVTDDENFTEQFKAMSSRLHLTRNNVFAIAAIDAAYRDGGPWLDDMLATITRNVDILRSGLPDEVRLVEPEGTYLAWLDLRPLGLDVPELAHWLVDEARLALSPGHWFGREGAGFARMTIAAPGDVVADAVDRLTAAI